MNLLQLVVSRTLRMETSLKTAKVVVPPQPDMASSSLDDELSEGEVAPAARSSSSDLFDPMLEFSRQLEDIISTHGSAASLLDQQSAVDAEREKAKEESTVDITVTTETDVSLVLQSLKNLSSPEEKLEDMVRKYTELVALRRCDEKKLCVLQQRLSVLLDEKLQLQAERLGSITARRKLETLCRELQSHYTTLREETLQRCREDEEKRKEMTTHFQQMLTEIQTQIEQHSNRNDKLCRENANLTDKLENLMSQCELREESLEKINKHRDLQHKLTEAKLQQANALLTEAEEKHKREKEYLLREAIDKTKKCFAMKEQELTMKKKLALYAQKFDEFQATLAKSNEIYVCFKKEMDNMSAKMKKVEKESNLWKTRFENCNKALTDMLEERTEKSKEYDLFVLKIQKLEKLCHALQDERKVLYAKIKEVRHTNSMLPLKVFSGSNASENAVSDDDDGKHGLLKPAEVQELEQEDPVLTKDMARLREEQARLQEFAASLLTTPADNDNNDDIDLEEDAMASAFVQFKSKPRAKEELVSVPEQATETDLPLPDKVEESQKPETSEMIPTQPQPEAVEAEVKEVQQVQPEEEIHHQQPSEQEATPGAEKVEISPPTGTLEASSEVQPVAPVEDEKLQEAAEPVEVTEGSNGDASKKQAAKKKKKKGSKSSS